MSFTFTLHWSHARAMTALQVVMLHNPVHIACHACGVIYVVSVAAKHRTYTSQNVSARHVPIPQIANEKLNSRAWQHKLWELAPTQHIPTLPTAGRAIIVFIPSHLTQFGKVGSEAPTVSSTWDDLAQLQVLLQGELAHLADQITNMVWDCMSTEYKALVDMERKCRSTTSEKC